jgi:hypothetical protein
MSNALGGNVEGRTGPPPTEAESQIVEQLTRCADALELVVHGLDQALTQWDQRTGSPG